MHIGPWPAFEIKQVIFSEQIPERFKKFKAIWPLLKGTRLWALWIQRNEKIFAKIDWSDEQVINSIWQAMLECGQLA